MTDNPNHWLWQQLEAILTPMQITALRAGYKAQTDRYNRAAKIRQIKREIATFERIVTLGSRVEHYTARIVRRKARLAELEASDETL